MTSFVTQCPHCRTRFRIGRSQLRAARGAARCGACMVVFNAAHHLLRDDIDPTRPLTPPPLAAEQAEPDAIATAASPSPRSSDETLWIHDDLDLDSLDLDAELAKLERQERELSADLNALRHDSPGTSLPHEAPADEAASQDESWAELLLNAEQSVSARRTDEPDDPISFTPVSAETPRQPAPLAPSTSALSTARAQQARNERVEPELAPPEQPMQAAEAIAPPRREPDLRDEPLFELDDEPLQLDWQERKNPWPRRLGWGALNLLALLALGAQYVVYNYDELSRQAAYRPWFERVCPTLGCELPALVDISQIKSSNLVVRSHPTSPGRWWSTPSSTTVPPSRSLSRSWKSASPTSTARQQLQAQRIPLGRACRTSTDAPAGADPHRSGHPRPGRAGGELQPGFPLPRLIRLADAMGQPSR